MVVMTMASTAAEPIQASWKVSQVLQRYPDLLEVFIATDPAFSKLRNPVLRRVQSRLVTVEQAARIAGIEPPELVRTLNQHLGLESDDDGAIDSPADAQDVSRPPWVGTAPVAVELDVREHQRRGEEPFGPIMEAVRQVPQGQVLVLRNTFEPVPLYDVLGMRGFEHWAERHAADDWEISFYNTGRSRQRQPEPVATHADDRPLDWDAAFATITIDVSELVPPEPMIRILEALEDLPAGGSLLVHHLRRPMHLYPRLDELGCRHETRELTPGHVEILIQKPAAGDGGS
jgi:uncharacterized protein (DUF2249 family)